jgi:diacylglycerol kinase family enzyme
MSSVLIVNPRASRVTEPLVDEVARALGVADILRTERAAHATELAASLGEVDRIYVFSGDGGFNEVLNGAPAGPALGFVPGGGTSVLPRALGLPRDAVAAARLLASGRTRRISVGRANGRRFGFSAGLGLDAELIRRMDARGRDATGKRPGDLVFAWTAVQALAAHRARFEPSLEIAGHGSAAFALVANSDPYTYLGRVPLRLPRGADFERGLDLLGPRSFRARDVPGAVRYLLTGRTRIPLVTLRDQDRIEIRCFAPMPLQIDGEDLGDVTEVVLEAERAAVDVLVPLTA